MNHEDIKVGGIYKPVSGYCGTFDDLNSVHIKIIRISGGYLGYDILDKNKKKIGSCCNCFKAENLEPVEETMKHIFKVGDKVRVKEGQKDLTFGIATIRDWLGKTLTISEITKFGNYLVEENCFAWREDMLEPVTNRSAIGKKAYKTFLKHGGKRDSQGRFSNFYKIREELRSHCDCCDRSKPTIQVDWEKLTKDIATDYGQSPYTVNNPECTKRFAKAFKKHNLLREGVEI